MAAALPSPGVDDPSSATETPSATAKFGQQLLCFRPGCGWLNHVIWDNSGKSLFCCSHGATLADTPKLHWLDCTADSLQAEGDGQVRCDEVHTKVEPSLCGHI